MGRVLREDDRYRTMLSKRELIPIVAIVLSALLAASCRQMSAPSSVQTGGSAEEQQCLAAGWEKVILNVDKSRRELLWKGPSGAWRKGAIVVMHGGGGKAAHFCGGGRLVGPQIRFAEMAISRGFAVFALESTNDQVTDANGRVCGKRFDFSVLDRQNLDLPYIDKVLTQVIPARRPPNSSDKIFMTGLSTGGYMTIRAATYFDDKIAAFAPISAGDPYGTETNCDPSLSPRKSAKGILLDNETGKQIVEDDACLAPDYPHEKRWPTGKLANKPIFRQFHHASDGIVDLSCMKKATTLLKRHGYTDAGAYVIPSRGAKRVWNHLWLDDYNKPLLEFLESQSTRMR